MGRQAEKELNMKIAIWGIGKIFEYNKLEISMLKPSVLIDKNDGVVGKSILGCVVKYPWEVDYEQIDYIIVSSTKYIDEIRQELLNYGVDCSKIVDIKNVGNVFKDCIPIEVHTSNGIVDIEKWSREHEKKILLNSHELSFTGTPILLYNLAIILRNMGYSVLFTSIRPGEFAKELEKAKFDYIDNLRWIVESTDFVKAVSTFERIISVNIDIQNEVRSFAKIGIPVDWWIHESAEKCYEKELRDLPGNISLYGGGKRVIHQFAKHYPELTIKEWLYNIPDCSNDNRSKKRSSLVFAIVGTVCQRKAQDILLDAIDMLSDEKKGKIEVWIMGGTSSGNNNYADMILERIKKMKNVSYLGELNQEQMKNIYNDIDVMVCPSRDDPMPLVVTEAMIHKIPVIISTEVGQVEFITDGKNGFIASTPNEIKQKIEQVVDDFEEAKNIGAEGRKIYESHFTTEMMIEALGDIL